MLKGELSRKDFLKSVVISAVAASLPSNAPANQGAPAAGAEITIDDLKAFTKLAGLSFSDDELKETLSDVKDWLTGYKAVRDLPIPFEVEPPTVFTPKTHRMITAKAGVSVKTTRISNLKRPASDEDLAFMSVRQLGDLIRTRQVSPVELTELYLARLRKFGDKLNCVITLMPEQALERAHQAQRELEGGWHLGPLHGIPCGIKDLFAMRGAPTTWGADPYKEQVLPYDSAVVERLHAAGAIVLAKLSMGALAMNDVWFKGRTNNPWNLNEGSSGSSAGSAAATAAGLVAFTVGTETLGSIVSPSNRCRVTGFRPTYGRISRYGAMGLSYSMDKVGPICREVEDCALVFAALTGHDPRDRASVDRPFHYRPDVKVTDLKVGVLAPDPTSKDPVAPDAIASTLTRMGISPRAVKIDPIPEAIVSVLEVEAAASFDELTRSDRIHQLTHSDWPETFRASRFVPGVEYLQAQRARAWLMDRFEDELGDLDVLVLPGVGRPTLRITNLTGHPQVNIPQGADEKGASVSVSFVGRIYEEDQLLAFARAYQELGGYHRLRPNLVSL